MRSQVAPAVCGKIAVTPVELIATGVVPSGPPSGIAMASMYGDSVGHWDGVTLVPGARLPTSIPLAPVPASVVANVPTLAPYSYAYVDDRVYLVDPGSGIIVAELTRAYGAG